MTRSIPPKKIVRKHEVRIIGGQWKRTPLPVVDAPGLRPTPDRVRETLFNWLYTLRGGVTQLRCLDAFAGTGALGFEAASRGAARVLMIEKNPKLLKQLQVISSKLQAKTIDIRAGDALLQIGALTETFDLVFLDPPYNLQLLPNLLEALIPALAENALIYIEDSAPLMFAGWSLVRNEKAGMVHYGLLQRAIFPEKAG